jgi:hypothetical protein
VTRLFLSVLVGMLLLAAGAAAQPDGLGRTLDQSQQDLRLQQSQNQQAADAQRQQLQQQQDQTLRLQLQPPPLLTCSRVGRTVFCR